MIYPAYSEYKDTELKWFRKIPQNWEVRRYKHALTLFQGAAFKSSEYVPESDVVNIRMGNIKKGGYIDLNHNVKYLPTEYRNSYSQYELKEGDLIIAMTDMSPSLDFLAVPAYMTGLDDSKTYLLNQRVGKLAVNKRFNTDYLKYLLLSSELRSQLKAQGLGTVQSNMSSENLYGSFFIAPSLEEQAKIAIFLDRETQKIDRLIEKQQQLIKLLQEKRQAVISHAVTKGLNPNAEMKDSGVEWLGEIPAHWEFKPIKYISRINSNVLNENTDDDYEFKYIDIGSVSSEGEILKTERMKFTSAPSRARRLVKNGDVIISTVRTYLRAIAPIEENAENYIVSTGFCVIEPVDYLVPEYCSFALRSPYFVETVVAGSVGVSYPATNASDIANIYIPLPSTEEQIQIGAFLVCETKKIDCLIDKCNTAIQLSKERRTALISAAVTGKIDVRHIAMDNTDKTTTKQDAISA